MFEQLVDLPSRLDTFGDAIEFGQARHIDDVGPDNGTDG